MPKITVEIEWNAPNVDDWLNANNVAIALNSYFDHSPCATKVVVTTVPTEQLEKDIINVDREIL